VNTKQQTLAWLARMFDGVREDSSKGPNRGQLVEKFQKAVDGKAQGEPWCAAFVQYLLKEVDGMPLHRGEPAHVLPKTEATQPLWNTSPLYTRTDKPEVGSVVVWRKDSGSGHCGIVVEVTPSLTQGDLLTIEGNTGTGDQREGDGVCLKRRAKGQIPGMALLGFLKPWG
jgi:uncharacterized protein YijF (DUF1287 family)